MRIELLVNLKTTHGGIIPRGSIFSDEYKPIPGTISRKIGTPLVRILPDSPVSQSPVPQIVLPDEAVTMEAPEPKQSEIFMFQEEPLKESLDMEAEPPQIEEAAPETVPVEEKPPTVAKRRVRAKKKTAEIDSEKTTVSGGSRKTSVTKPRRRRKKTE
jgi:hypothetical protein